MTTTCSQYAQAIRSSPGLGHDDVCNMIARPLMLILLATLAGCSEDRGPTEAMTAFAAFQTALQQRNPGACRELLTTESQAVLADIPWDAVAEKQPLHVLRATRPNHDEHVFRVHVEDPNNEGAPAQFVVVREYGRLVVDLVASAGLTARVVEASGSKEQFEPAQLTPKDHERIRQYELSQPPR